MHMKTHIHPKRITTEVTLGNKARPGGRRGPGRILICQDSTRRTPPSRDVFASMENTKQVLPMRFEFLARRIILRTLVNFIPT